MTIYSAVLTTAGEALYAAALASGTPITLSTMAVGDGGGSPVASPDPTRTTLVNQVYSTAISDLYVDGSNPDLMWSSMIIAPSVGGFTIREVGIFTAGGVLFAIANFPDTIKAVAASGITADLVINMGMSISNTALVTLSIDPSVVSATRAWVLSTITPAYIFPGGTQYQVLQKNSSTGGDASWVDPGSPWEATIATTGGVALVSALQAYNKLIKVTGALTSDCTLTFPAAFGKWTVINATTGAHVVTAIALGGAGVPILQGEADTIHCDGTNIFYSMSSALTRTAGDNSLALANTAYVDRAVSDVGAYETDTGAANAYVIATVPPTTAYANGMTFRFKVAHANTAASTFNAGAGTAPLVRDDGAALQSGDLPVSTLATVTYDAGTTSFILGSVVYSQFGNVARLTASDVLGGVSATQVYAGNPNGHVAGNAASGQIPPSTVWDTADGVIWYCTTTGNSAGAVWVAPDLQFGGTIVAASQTVGPGVYYVDTSAGAITLTVAAALAGVYTFIDAKNTWGTNNLTINGGGHNIGNTPTNVASTFLADVSDYQFSIEAASTYWRLL